MPTTRQCSECGTPLPDEVPEGACPVCALRGALELPEDISEVAVTEKPGDRIGRYKLLEKIGEGGYGVVYMAEQAEPIRRRVALKVIKLGMDTKQVIARFEAERQAIALMDHPNIAMVLDAGATGTGRPYFVMELVHGSRITDYCDQHKLRTKERLDLFIQVCQAIQHAHQKGIIHRDLKPSNILVTELDGRPVPKVIDFGIAKATGQQLLTDKTLFTAFQQFIGTPAYMSPEQAGLSGADVDTRSDIYALGVLLYELLTSHLPFEKQLLLHVGFDEMRRLIQEEEPPKPSTRLSALSAEALTTVAIHQHTEPPKLLHLVRGDLDWIAMKCLEKDRDRRYGTANGLAMDVQNHLSHEPVEARPPSRMYRLQKTIRRNRSIVAASAAVAAALLAGLTLSTRMFLKEKEARQRLEVRAYLSDMGVAMRMATMRCGLGGIGRLLAAWQDHSPDLRGWEWYYLNAVCHQDLLTIHADTNGLWSVAWSPDGQRLATCGAEGVVKIWDAATGQQLAGLRGHTGQVMSVAWSPDGGRLASGGSDATVRIWIAATATETVTLQGHTAPVSCLAWNPDGTSLASGSSDTTVRIWDSTNAAKVRTLQARSVVLSLSWMNHGTRLAASGGDNMLAVWELPEGKILWSLDAPRTSYRGSLAPSPDGRQVATGSSDFTIDFRDAATGTNITTFWGHRNSVTSLAWDPSGARLASVSQGDGLIKVWDTAAGREIQSFPGHAGSARCVSWRPDGRLLASAGADGAVKLWDTTRGDASVTALSQPDQVVSLAWHPDGSKLATGGRRSSAWVWDLTKSSGPIALSGQADWTAAVAWNPVGTRLATGASDGVLRVWDLASRTDVWHAQVTPYGAQAVAWSPDSRRLASAGASGQLSIWDADTGRLHSTFALRGQGSYSLAWSPDGRYLAVPVKHEIQILDAVTGAECRWLRAHADLIRSVCWSPDGKSLASAGEDACVKIWNVAAGKEVQNLLGHAGPVRSVAWSPDGTRLVSGSWDKTFRIWEPVSGVEISSLNRPGELVYTVAWSSDGTRIAVGDSDGSILIYDCAPKQRNKDVGGISIPSDHHDGATAHAINSLKAYCETAGRPAANDDPDALRRLAWIYATSRYPELRDGRKAVQYAERAIALTSRSNSDLLVVLAAALAEAGDFAAAADAQKEAIALVSSEQGRMKLASRLRLYVQRLPYRDDSL